MRASDLMIGDLVKYDNKVCKVCTIEAQMLLLSFNGGERLTREDKVEPVPITKEILEKNGWVKFQMYYRYLIDDTEYFEWYPHESRLQRLYIHKDNSREVLFTVSGIPYVHLLQHALRLCRIDKEITL